MFTRTLIAAAVLAMVAAFAGDQAANAAPVPKGDYIVVLNDSVSDPGAVAARHARAFGGRVGHVYRHALKGYSVTLPTSALPALEANPLVEFVSEDGEARAAETCPLNTTSGFPTQCVPPGIDRIEADLSSAVSGDGSGSVNINVAVLDDGIDLDHPDLNVVGGIDCSGGKGFDAADYHGTFVAGIIAAKDNGFGVVGVVPGARLWAVRVLKKHGQGSWSNVLCGVDFVTSTRFDADATNDIAVANMSLGGKGTDGANCGGQHAALHRAICNSVSAGVVYVVSAGNAAADFAGESPANYDEVLTVTAMADYDGQPGSIRRPCIGSDTSDDSRAIFSNFATLPDDQAHTTAAPGVCVVSTFPVGFLSGTNYGISSGTSFSSPHAAGTVALCISSGACAGLTPAQIIQKMRGDAAAYSTANPSYGFFGDPNDPEPGKYFGYLIRAGGY